MSLGMNSVLTFYLHFRNFIARSAQLVVNPRKRLQETMPDSCKQFIVNSESGSRMYDYFIQFFSTIHGEKNVMFLQIVNKIFDTPIF